MKALNPNTNAAPSLLYAPLPPVMTSGAPSPAELILLIQLVPELIDSNLDEIVSLTSLALVPPLNLISPSELVFVAS